MNIFQVIFASAFLVIVSIIPLVNSASEKNKNRALKIVPFISGIGASFLFKKIMPGGLIELAILASYFGAVFSFYSIFDTAKNKSAKDKLAGYLRWFFSGLFTYVGFSVLISLFLDSGFRFFSLVSFALSLPVIILLSSKIKDSSHQYILFVSSLFTLSIPSMYKFFADFVHFLIHEMIHLNYITFMFPDHPFLEPRFYQAAMNTVYNSTVTGFASFAFFLMLSFGIIFKLHWNKNQNDQNISDIDKRLLLASFKRKWHIELIIVLVVIAMLFTSAMKRVRSEEGIATDYLPIQATAGYITLNTSKPLYQIKDGELKKYQLMWEGKPINFVVYRWNGKLKTVMDFCEFCVGEDEGFYLKNNQLICKICETPVNPDAIGTGGGCNPVPLKSETSDFQVRIERDELIKAYTDKKGGR